MNIPLRPEFRPFFQDAIGNAGNGGAPNPPTIPNQHPGTFPRVNLHPVFRIGAYNNAEESFRSTTLNPEYWKKQYNTNNPIGFQEWGPEPGGKTGNAGNGDNKNGGPFGCGYRPTPWAPYDVASLGARAGTSQSYPYNANALHVDGGNDHSWNFSNNVNRGNPQDYGSYAGATPEEFAATVKKLQAEMDFRRAIGKIERAVIQARR